MDLVESGHLKNSNHNKKKLYYQVLNRHQVVDWGKKADAANYYLAVLKPDDNYISLRPKTVANQSVMVDEAENMNKH